MGSKMDIFSKVSDDKMLKIYHDMLESNMIGSKSTMIRAYAKELASVYPFETNAQGKDIFRFRKVQELQWERQKEKCGRSRLGGGRLTMIIAGSAKTGIIAADVNC